MLLQIVKELIVPLVQNQVFWSSFHGLITALYDPDRRRWSYAPSRNTLELKVFRYIFFTRPTYSHFLAQYLAKRDKLMKKVGFWINFAPLCAHSRFFSILVTGRKLFWWEATCFWFLNFDFFVWEKCLRSRRSSVSVLSLTSDIAATFQRQRRDKSSIHTFWDGLLVWWWWNSYDLSLL